MSVQVVELVDENGIVLAKAEDAAHADGDYGVVLLAVRKDTAAALAGDGDYIPLIVDASGNLRVALATTPTIDIGDVTLLAGTALVGKVGIDQATANANEVVLKASTADIGKVGHDKTGVADGVITVTTPLTDVPLVSSSTPAKAVIVQAQTDNTGAVAVGGEGVVATIATGTGIILYAGDWTPPLEVDDLADVWIDAIVGGEGVRFIYFT